MIRWLTLLADSIAQGLGWATGVVLALALWNALGLPLGPLL